MKSHETLTHAMQTYQSKEEPERLFAIAGKYWRVMLFIEIVVFAAAVLAGAYLLFVALFGLNDGKTQTSATLTLNKELLSSTVQGFADRKTFFDQLESTPASVPDPSR
jgi:hypothetical protein